MEAGVVLVIAVVVAYLWGQHEAEKAAKWVPPSEEELDRKYPTVYRDYEEYAVAEAVKEVEREEREARKHRRKRSPGIDAPKPPTEQDHINTERWEKARRNAEKADRDAKTAIPYADRPAAYLGLNEQEWIRMRGNLPGVLPAGSMSVLDRMWDDYLQDPPAMTAEQSSRLLVAFQKINEDIDAEYDGKACVDAHAVLGGASEADASYTYQANVPGHGAPVWCRFKSPDLDAASCVLRLGHQGPHKEKETREQSVPEGSAPRTLLDRIQAARPLPARRPSNVPAESFQEPIREPHPSGVVPNPSASLAYWIFLDRASAEKAAIPFLGTPGLEIDAVLRLGMVEYRVLVSHGSPEVEYLCTDGQFHAPALGIGGRTFPNPSSSGDGRPGE